MMLIVMATSASAQHTNRDEGNDRTVRIFSLLPPGSGKMSPLSSVHRGLEEMTDASLQRGRQG